MASKRGSKSQQNALQRFGRETVGELRKVSWPTRKQAVGLTWIVILVMIAMGALLGSLDWLFFRFFTWLLGT